jgi:hypothetical protein
MPFGLTMHVGSPTTKYKTDCMFFPATLNPAITQVEKNLLLDFVTKFKFLGSFITPLLNENAEIDSRIKKAKSIMGASRSFFSMKMSTAE